MNASREGAFKVAINQLVKNALIMKDKLWASICKSAVSIWSLSRRLAFIHPEETDVSSQLWRRRERVIFHVPIFGIIPTLEVF
jgi:hypothetical protein